LRNERRRATLDGFCLTACGAQVKPMQQARLAMALGGLKLGDHGKSPGGGWEHQGLSEAMRRGRTRLVVVKGSRQLANLGSAGQATGTTTDKAGRVGSPLKRLHEPKRRASGMRSPSRKKHPFSRYSSPAMASFFQCFRLHASRIGGTGAAQERKRHHRTRGPVPR